MDELPNPLRQGRRAGGLPPAPSISATPAVSATIESMRVLGVLVHLVDMQRATTRLLALAGDTRSHMVFVRDVASLMLAVDTPRLRLLHDRASLVVPDGAPLVQVGRLYGHGAKIGRVPGADLVESVCASTLATGQRHFFYGGKPGVADLMAKRLRQRYPGLTVVGTLSPPMREIDSNYALSAEAMNEISIINATKADFIWIGLSSPKQEYWMNLAAPLLHRGVCVGVGAAFDFHSGRVRRAPKLMRKLGLEWLYRFVREPRRLWKRYLVLAPRFVFLLVREWVQRWRAG